MKMLYLFDVDGTLTSSSQPMQADFAAFFRGFLSRHPVYLISGSDYPKLRKQVPRDVLEKCKGVFACAGAQYYEGDTEVYTKDHRFSRALVKICEDFIDESPYPFRAGTHIDKRPGMLNISVIGRKATLKERADYHLWDSKFGERREFVKRINISDLPYEASAGGEISIDITPKGWNKSIAKHEILARNPNARLVFFGDRINDGGNDKPLADALAREAGRHQVIAVRDYCDTWERLKEITASA